MPTSLGVAHVVAAAPPAQLTYFNDTGATIANMLNMMARFGCGYSVVTLREDIQALLG